MTVAVAAGSLLALWHLRAIDGEGGPPLAAGVAHGVVGALGLALFLLSLLGGPVRGAATGVASFGALSAWLCAGALLTGVVMFWLKRKGPVMAIHAGVAISGYVLLLAWNALG